MKPRRRRAYTIGDTVCQCDGGDWTWPSNAWAICWWTTGRYRPRNWARFRGRTAVAELLEVDERIAALVADAAVDSEIP